MEDDVDLVDDGNGAPPELHELNGAAALIEQHRLVEGILEADVHLDAEHLAHRAAEGRVHARVVADVEQVQ